MTSVLNTTPLSRRSILAGMAGLAGASTLALAGCGGSSDKGGGADQLTFWVSLSTAQQKGFDDLIAQYKKAKGVTLKIVNVPYDGYSTKLRNAAQANSLPDVASVPALDPIWKNALVDLADIVNTSSNKIIKDYVYSDGKQTLCIPSDVTSTGLFLNKTMWNKAGVDFPTDPTSTWTWDEFITKANTVRQKAGGKYSLVYDASPSRLRAQVYEMGGQYVHRDSIKEPFSMDAASQKAVETFVGYNDDKTMPKSVWTSGADPSALFQSGQVAAYWSGVWQVSAFETSITSFDWVSVPTPAQPKQAADVNSGGLMVAFKNSDAKAQAAKEFLTWMYQPTQYKTLCQTNGYLPVESGLGVTYNFKTDAANAAMKLYNTELPLYEKVSGYFLLAQSEWVLAGKALTEDPTVTELGKAINGQETVAAACKAIVAGYNKQLES